MGGRIWLRRAIVLAIALGAACAWWLQRPTEPELDVATLAARAEGQLVRAPRTALQIADEGLVDFPDAPRLLAVAGEACMRLQEFDDSLAYFQQIDPDDEDFGVNATFAIGEIKFHQHQLSDSERFLRTALARDPHHVLAKYRLSLLLAATGRRFEALRLQTELLPTGYLKVPDLVLLGDVERTLDQREFLTECQSRAPDDPAPRLGLAAVALAENRLDEAAELLSTIRQDHPNLIEAYVRWGELLQHRGTEEREKWRESMPPGADEHPATWAIVGADEQDRGRLPEAARCYWESIRIHPDRHSTNYRLGQILLELDRPDDAAVFLERAEQLQQLALIMDGLFHNSADVAAMAKAAELTRELGRYDEARAWASAALETQPQSPWALSILTDATPEADASPARNPAYAIDVASLPDVEIARAPDRIEPGHQPGPALDAGTQFHFVDDAHRLGIEFSYDNGADESTPGARITETTGGGVAALDFDGDRRPDLCFTQGDDRGPTASDQLLRNRSTAFDAVSDHAGIREHEFGQGVACGDVNSDGFQDLYVANRGPNSLLLNNGDGSFSAAALPDLEARWTTSCVIADFNGDGNPDLYDGNYCEMSPQLETICLTDGVWRSCSPLAFTPSRDRLLLSSADGSWHDASGSGIDAVSGYALGAVAFDLHDDGALDLFIANDQVPNYLFVNDGALSPQFAENGFVSGVAVNDQGRSQGCMGVAAADATGDGRLDFFVTNFYNESNVFYVQLPGGGFRDRTAEFGLRDPAYAMLGFGTQFLDADLDGWLDLVIANGHIDDLTSLGRPYRMRPQLMVNLGEGRFAEYRSEKTGDYFAGEYLGRGLARLDWNGDFREDFAVSHIGAPSALVTNQTPTTGAAIALRLAGRSSNRDGVGASITARVGDRSIIRHRLAGDGYQASNEPRMVIACGEASAVDELRIAWPSGTVDTFFAVPIGAEYVAVEGAATLHALAAADAP